MLAVAICVLFLGFGQSLLENDFLDKTEIKLEHFVYWANATIPFYIHRDHFDHEQTSIILTALTTFAYKTCLKFLPALEAPSGGQHVLVIENPNGVRQCLVSTVGHAKDEPHYLVLGYDCLRSPNIDMMLMKALGFGFEHNRAIRDLYIRVQKENINPSAMDLYVMDDKLPTELRALSYDVNSVLHFGERDHSKNGHRTILILDHKVKQCREGLSELDLRKIDIVYGPECRKRDRLEKIDLCQGYPGVARRKRSIDESVREKRDVEQTEVKSLRVNPDITPPPEIVGSTEPVQPGPNVIMDDLGLKDGVEEITNLVYRLGAQALTHVRNKHCNITNASEDAAESGRRTNEKKPDIFGVVELVANYVKDMVDHALTNLTAFCEVENDLRAYHSQRCNWNSGSDRCPGVYRSTKNWAVMFSTKHRPYIVQSTNHRGNNQRIVLYHQGRRDDGSDNVQSRRKRDAGSSDGSVRMKRDVERKFAGQRYNVRKRSEEERWDESEVSIEMRAEEKVIENPEPQNGPIEDMASKIRSRDINANGPKPKTVDLSKKNKEFYGERMWPDGVVRYIITQDKKYNLADLRRRLDAVNRILKARTCASIEEITEEDAERFEDYLVLDGSADYITGRVGGKQNFGCLELFEGGQHKQHTAMMVMAMLGFYFELARHDRDAHVRVHMRHVRPDKLHHFEKIRSDATLPLPYDYESATHPAWQFWRQLGRTGISTVATFKEKDPDGSLMRALGQHDNLLSETDIIKINSVYGTKCFDKKLERVNDDIDTGSVIQEVDLDKEVKNKHIAKKEMVRDSKPEKGSHKLESRNRPKFEKQRHEDGRYKDKEEHGRNRDKHRNKHRPDRDEEYDDRSRERNRDRDRHSIRQEHEKDRRIKGKHELERDKRINRDRYRDVRDDRFDRDRREKKRDLHRKRPRESDEDMEEQERVRGKRGHYERGREAAGQSEYESDRYIHEERDRELRHVRYQKRAEDKSKKHQTGGKRHENKDDIGISVDDKHRETEVEEVVIYKERNTPNEERNNNWNEPREEVENDEENNDNYDDRQALYHDEIRRGRKQIFAPVSTP